jgi:hypothetical protein
MDEQTTEVMAEKIRIATEMGYFIPLEEMDFLKDPKILPYIHEGTQEANKILRDSGIGSFLKKAPQIIVDELSNMSLGMLRAQKSTFYALAKTWDFEAKIIHQLRLNKKKGE